MQRKPVESSNIASIGYDEATKTLEVEFKGGSGVYTYSGVPKDLYGTLTAPNQGSVGKLFHTHVKGKFPHTKV